MTGTPTSFASIQRRKRFLRKELERLGEIRNENVLPEVLPFLKSYLVELSDELRSYEDDNA
jgi:hypothetical protein